MATRADSPGWQYLLVSPWWVTCCVLLFPLSDLKAEMKLNREQRPKRVAWRKSSFCVQGECAEVTHQNGMILLRSSLAPRAVIRYTPAEFRALKLGIKAGEFDDLG